MNHAQHTQVAAFLWGIADDVLRDIYSRGKYRDLVLPMTVLRRLDAVLEPTKAAVLDTKAMLDGAGIVNQDASLRGASGQAFYNTSPFKLRDLRSRQNPGQLRADFEAYLEGFSPNVREILDCFEFDNKIPKLSKADALGPLIEKFLDPQINLSPDPVLNGDGSIRLPGLDNHAMGTIFEELVRRFNEENNEEAGEHWTPRDAVKLMANLIFLPVAGQIESGTYQLYDGACGTGGMLTVAEETLRELAQAHGKAVSTYLFGQEINAETYAICKADLFGARVEATLDRLGLKLSAADKKTLLRVASYRVEDAPPVIAKTYKVGKATPDPLHGRYQAVVKGKPLVVEYESDSELRDAEQVPLLEEGGIEAFFRREVLPYTPDAWIEASATKVGYEISFTRHF